MSALHLQTRGRPRHRDYAFLGSGPERSWWRAYADHTAFERPTVLVESDAAGYRAYLSGIPSARRDAVGTVIRYTVVLEAAAGDTAADAPVAPKSVVALVACWLADQAADAGAGALSRALDAEFPEDEVERLLGAAEPAEVQRRVVAAVESLAGPAATPDVVDTPRSWVGDAGAPRARAAFVTRVEELVGGTPGRALLLNLVGSADDLGGLLADDRPLAVLAPDLGTSALTALGGHDPGAPLGKALPSAAMAPPRTAASNPAPRIPSPRVLAPVMLLLAVAVAVLIPLLLLVIPIVLVTSR